jgi:hypothetical protein
LGYSGGKMTNKKYGPGLMNYAWKLKAQALKTYDKKKMAEAIAIIREAGEEQTAERWEVILSTWPDEVEYDR